MTSVYSPAENTTAGITCLLQLENVCTHGVPIGRTISNSGAYVISSQLRLVPVGVIGKLILADDRLARGYIDLEQNANQFVSVVIGSQTVKAYRTEDYVIHGPTDGQLEFFGRVDKQVKIQGIVSN